MSGPAEVARVLAAARRVLIASHVPPDGDGLGTGLAFARTLRRAGRDAIFAAGGPLPPNLRAFPAPGEVDLSPGGPPGPFDAALVLDCADEGRLGALLPACRAAPVLVNLDHHETNTRFGTVIWVDGASPAVGEMALRVLREMGAAAGSDVALPLLLALVTDTGRFGYSNTTPGVLRAAAGLLEAGADPQAVTDAVYRSVSASWLRLLGRALADLRLEENGLVAHTSVTPEMLAETGADPLAAGDVVDWPISVEGVEVGLLFRPSADGGSTKVSFRSRRWFPVHELAARFGGGGHPRASGATVPLPLPEARRAVLAELLPAVRAALAEAGR